MSIKMSRVPTGEEIIQARKREFVTTVLSVFGDESTDQTGRRVFTGAGIAGTQEEWDALEPVWIKRTGATQDVPLCLLRIEPQRHPTFEILPHAVAKIQSSFHKIRVAMYLLLKSF
jgi:hypothetical protein